MNVVLKFMIVGLLMFVLNPIVHMPLDSLLHTSSSVAEKPDFLILFIVIFIQSAFLIIAFNLIKDYLPVKKPISKGLLFISFYLFAIQIPSVLGVIAFEKGAEWMFFTPIKIANYVTLLGDIIIFTIIGIVIAKLFPSIKKSNFKKTKNLYLSMILGALIFPTIFWLIMELFNAMFHLGGTYLPLNDSLWFNLIFYGIFFMTGLCIPILHSLIIQNKKNNRILFSLFIFLLMWMPVQNFMVVFGWSFLGGFLFSIISIIPIVIVIWISDIFMSGEGKALNKR